MENEPNAMHIVIAELGATKYALACLVDIIEAKHPGTRASLRNALSRSAEDADMQDLQNALLRLAKSLKEPDADMGSRITTP